MAKTFLDFQTIKNTLTNIFQREEMTMQLAARTI